MLLGLIVGPIIIITNSIFLINIDFFIYYSLDKYYKTKMMKKLSIIISFIISLEIIGSQRCQNNMTINIDTNCFNEILFFNTKNYRAGHFAINNKGDMVVEYSDEHSRLFYGLKNNGRNFFGTENNLKEINNLQNYNKTDAYQRYESNNIFVYLENDINKEKGYLFSTSSYITATELHDL